MKNLKRGFLADFKAASGLLPAELAILQSLMWTRKTGARLVLLYWGGCQRCQQCALAAGEATTILSIPTYLEALEIALGASRGLTLGPTEDSLLRRLLNILPQVNHTDGCLGISVLKLLYPSQQKSLLLAEAPIQEEGPMVAQRAEAIRYIRRTYLPQRTATGTTVPPV